MPDCQQISLHNTTTTNNKNENMSYTEKNQTTCLPPEAYIRLWQKAEKSTEMPKFRSTVYPDKKITSIKFEK